MAIVWIGDWVHVAAATTTIIAQVRQASARLETTKAESRKEAHARTRMVHCARYIREMGRNPSDLTVILVSLFVYCFVFDLGGVGWVAGLG